MNLKIFLIIFFIFLISISCVNSNKINQPLLANLNGINEYSIDTLLKSNPNQLDLIYLLGQLSIYEDWDSIVIPILVDKIANHTISEIQKNNFNKNNQQTRYLIKKLENKNYYFNLYPPSDVQKFMLYFKEGNYNHILDRVLSKVLSKGYSLIITILVIVIAVIYFVKFKN